jgi:hypothetical protein
MNIKIMDGYRLKSDECGCWITKECKQKDGKKLYERTIGNYRTPADAFKAVLDRKIRTSDAEDLKAIISLVAAHTKLVEAFIADSRDGVLK